MLLNRQQIIGVKWFKSFFLQNEAQPPMAKSNWGDVARGKSRESLRIVGLKSNRQQTIGVKRHKSFLVPWHSSLVRNVLPTERGKRAGGIGGSKAHKTEQVQ